jgi:hypothetical protein
MIAGLVALMLPAGFALGQSGASPSHAVWKNARGGAFAARRPGLMVQRGISRYSSRQNDIISRARVGPDIVDTAADRPVSPWKQARIESINIIFENLTGMITALDLYLQAGGSLWDRGTSGGGTTTTDFTDLLGGAIAGPES